MFFETGRGVPRAVELFTACAVPDLSAYALGLNDDDDGVAFTFPQGRGAAAGDFIHVAFKVPPPPFPPAYPQSSLPTLSLPDG